MVTENAQIKLRNRRFGVRLPTGALIFLKVLFFSIDSTGMPTLFWFLHAPNYYIPDHTILSEFYVYLTRNSMNRHN